VRHAWAYEVTVAGKVIWRAHLPTNATDAGVAVQPLAVGGEAVFAEFNAVYALRRPDGRQLWQHSFPYPKSEDYAGWVYDLWYWHGTVIALSGQVSSTARLTAIDAATGAVRWTLKLPSAGLLGTQAMTSNGVLGMLRPNGVLAAADLSTGKVLWSHKNGTSPGPVAVGDVIVAGSNGRAIGYDAKTGAVLWTARGLPATTMLTEADGLVLVQSDVFGGTGDPTAVTALEPRTGRVAWRFDIGIQPEILGAGPAGIVMAIYNPDRLYLVNQATGRARWSAATFAAALSGGDGVQIVTAGSVVQVEGRGVPHLVKRSAATGKVLWSTALTGSLAGLHLALAGPNVLVTLGPPTGTAGSRLWAFRLASGTVAGSTALAALATPPMAAAGTETLVQVDDPVCAVALSGTAVTTRAAHSSLRRTASPSISIWIFSLTMTPPGIGAARVHVPGTGTVPPQAFRFPSKINLTPRAIRHTVRRH
jgi:outer membrane protein assembly factor BamB